MTRRFAVIAATVAGNRGAEAMLETTIGRLRDRYPDARFELFSYYPAEDRALISDPSITVHSCTPAALVFVHLPWALLVRGLRVPRRLAPASIRALAQCDALVDLAGVSFIDGREKFLPFNVLTIWPAMMLGVPVFKLSQALGPFRNPLNRYCAKVLRRCSLIVPRGEVTVENLRELGLPEDLTLPAPDVAFMFEQRDALSIEGREEADRIVARARTLVVEGHEVVGVCPSAVIAARARKQGWDYTGFVADIVRGLLGSGKAVVLFPNATRAASGGELRNNDLPVIADVVDRLKAQERENLVAVRGDMNAAELRDVVMACSCVTVSRFHAMVGALSAGVPALVLGWSHKYLEVMKQFGQERYVFDYQDNDPAQFLERMLELLSRRDEAAQEISAALPEVRTACAAQFDELARRLA